MDSCGKRAGSLQHAERQLGCQEPAGGETHCVVFIIIIIIVSLFVIIRIIAVVVRIQPFVLMGT